MSKLSSYLREPAYAAGSALLLAAILLALPSSWVPLLTTLLAVASAVAVGADVYTTRIALSTSHAREANPIVRYVGLTGTALLRVAANTATAYVASHGYKSVMVASLFVAAVTFWVAERNLALATRRS